MSQQIIPQLFPGILLLIAGTDFTLASPAQFPYDWDHFLDFQVGSSSKKESSGEREDINSCLPECLAEEEFHPDLTSCNHFFICTQHSKIQQNRDSNLLISEVNSLPESHQLVLLRCSCPGRRDVYNRYLKRCSRRGHCRISCSNNDHTFKNWKTVVYEGFTCSIVQEHITAPEEVTEINAIGLSSVQTINNITKLLPTAVTSVPTPTYTNGPKDSAMISIQTTQLEALSNLQSLKVLPRIITDNSVSTPAILEQFFDNTNTATSSKTRDRPYILPAPSKISSTIKSTLTHFQGNPSYSDTLTNGSTMIITTQTSDTNFLPITPKPSILTEISQKPTISSSLDNPATFPSVIQKPNLTLGLGQKPQSLPIATAIPTIQSSIHQKPMPQIGSTLDIDLESSHESLTHTDASWNTSDTPAMNSTDTLTLSGVALPSKTISKPNKSLVSNCSPEINEMSTPTATLVIQTTNSLISGISIDISPNYTFIPGVMQSPTDSNTMILPTTHTLGSSTSELSTSNTTSSYTFIPGVSQASSTVPNTNHNYTFITGVIQTPITQQLMTQNYTFISGVTQVSSQSYTLIPGVSSTFSNVMTPSIMQTVSTLSSSSDFSDTFANYTFIPGATQTTSSLPITIQPNQTSQSFTHIPEISRNYTFISGVTHSSAITSKTSSSQSYSFIPGITQQLTLSNTMPPFTMEMQTTLSQSIQSSYINQNYTTIPGITQTTSILTTTIHPDQTSQNYTFIPGVNQNYTFISGVTHSSAITSNSSQSYTLLPGATLQSTLSNTTPTISTQKPTNLIQTIQSSHIMPNYTFIPGVTQTYSTLSSTIESEQASHSYTFIPGESKNYTFISGVTHSSVIISTSSSSQSYTLLPGITQQSTFSNFVTSTIQSSHHIHNHTFISGVTQAASASNIPTAIQPNQTSQSYNFISGITHSSDIMLTSSSSQSYTFIPGEIHNHTFISGVTHASGITPTSSSSQIYTFIPGVTHSSGIPPTSSSSQIHTFIPGVTQQATVSNTMPPIIMHKPSTLTQTSQSMHIIHNKTFIPGVTQTTSILPTTIQPEQTSQSYTFVPGVTQLPPTISGSTSPLFTSSITKPIGTETPALPIATFKPTSTSSASATLQTTPTPSILPDIMFKPTNCEPQKCLVANSRFPNPKDCGRYYKCLMSGGTLVARPYICPSVMPTFSPTLMMCLRGIKCHPSCSEYDESSASKISLMTTRINNLQGRPSISLAYTYTANIPKPSPLIDNSEMVVPINSISTETSKNNSSYDISIGITTALSNPCKLTCTAPNIKVADPTDCHYYYLCMISENKTPRPIKVRCPRSRPVFSLRQEECMSNIPCIIRCHTQLEVNPSDSVQPISAITQSTSTSSTLSLSMNVTLSSLEPTSLIHSLSMVTSSSVALPGSSKDNTPTYSSYFETATPISLTPIFPVFENGSDSFTISNSTEIISMHQNPLECSPVCLTPDSWLADPTDCHYFYVCHFLNDALSKPRRIACPPNRPIFSRQEGRCLNKGPCIVTCQMPVTISPTAPTESEVTDCNHKCTEPFSTVPDPTDCNHYYICIFLHNLTLESVRAKCPRSKPYFDHITKKCSVRGRCKTCIQSTTLSTPSTDSIQFSTTDSQNECIPQCKEPNTIIPDPNSCNNYYICSLTENSSMEAIKMKCPEKLNIFDVELGSCTADSECKIFCSKNISISTGESLSDQVTSLPPNNHTIFEMEIQSHNTPGMEMTTAGQILSTVSPISSTTTSKNATEMPKKCQPVCESHNSITHDPLSCYTYYICMINDGKKYLSKVLCPAERPIFHLNTYTCQINVPCIRTCEDFITENDINISIESVFPALLELINANKTDIEFSGNDSLIVNDTLLAYNENISFTDDFTHTENLSSTDEISFTDLPSIIDTVTKNTENSLDITSSSSMVTTSVPIFNMTAHSPHECNPQCKRQGTLVPDLSDCNYYYVCILLSGLIPQPIRRKCPSESPIFDINKKECVANGDCYRPCANTLVTSTNFVDVTTQISHTTASCLVSCKVQYTVMPDPLDCQHYYYCSKSNVNSILSPVRMKCPRERPIFSAKYLTCNNNIPCITNNCNGNSSDTTNLSTEIISHLSANMHCPHAGFFANSERCIRSYDMCHHEGQNLIKTKKRCPDGLVFNPVSTYPYCVPPSDCPFYPSGPTANATSCRHPGLFPKCKHCCSDYILCEPTTGGLYNSVPVTCSGSLVFNTDPRYPVCLEKSECPSGAYSGKECDIEGNFPACSTCCRNYNHCTNDGKLQERICPYPLVFNNHPSYPYCVLAWNCPYILP